MIAAHYRVKAELASNLIIYQQLLYKTTEKCWISNLEFKLFNLENAAMIGEIILSVPWTTLTL